MKIIKEIPGTNDVKLSIDKSKPELQIKLDREKMEQLGLNVQQVGSAINLSLAGNTDLQYSDGDDDFDINVKFDQFNRKKIDDVGSLTFLNNQGKIVELKNFATITQSLGPNKLERYDRISSLTVKCSVYGRPVGTVGEEIKTAIKEKIHSPEITIDYKGQMERQSDAFSSLFTAIIFALILVYLVMVALYNSYLYPFVVLFSIPVAIIGALFALALSGESLTIFSMVGMIMLIGLVCKNAILIVDFANKFRDKGLTVREALIEAGKERLRPILMTTFSMIFGMLPIALASGASAESKNGLAWVIIGGLTSSLLLTLVLVPSVYMTMEKYKEKYSTLKYIHDQFLIKANEKSIDLNLKLSLSYRDVNIVTDETKLVQVLTNLLENSLKFTKNGYVNFGYTIQDNELEFFVEDSGIGIPSNMHQEIFERFRQVESTNTRRFGGSGLGLSISKAYIELLGGRIWLISELNKGSIFYFTLPFKRIQKNTSSEKRSGDILKFEIEQPKTLLVAEDEDSNYMLLEEMLSGFNINIIRAMDGAEAIRICKSEHIDMVLMDMKMPVMDGYEATKIIREFMPLLPIIAQTAYSSEIDKNKALACGCTDFISKPLKREYIISTIKGQLNQT